MFFDKKRLCTESKLQNICGCVFGTWEKPLCLCWLPSGTGPPGKARHVTPVLMRARSIKNRSWARVKCRSINQLRKSHLEPSACARGSPTWGHPASKPESGRCWDDRATKEGKKKKDRQRERAHNICGGLHWTPQICAFIFTLSVHAQT